MFSHSKVYKDNEQDKESVPMVRSSPNTQSLCRATLCAKWMAFGKTSDWARGSTRDIGMKALRFMRKDTQFDSLIFRLPHTTFFFFATIPLVCSSLPLFEFKFTHRRTMWRYRWRSVMRIRKRKMYANMYSYYYYIASYEIYTFSILPPSSSSSSFVVPLTSASTISSIGRCVCVCCALHHFFVLNGVLVDVLYLYLLVKCDGFIVHIAKGLPVTKPFALSTTDLAYNHLDGI